MKTAVKIAVGFAIILLSSLLLIVAVFSLRDSAPARLAPAEFLAKSESERRSRPVLVAVGDSLTKGQVSADYLETLRSTYPGLWVVNAGVNGDSIHNVLRRLNDIVALEPQYVTILIGTNDVMATQGNFEAFVYKTRQKLEHAPDLKSYVEAADKLLNELKSRTKAEIALVTLPPIGEDPMSEVNATADRFTAALMGVADRHGIDVIPARRHLFDRLREVPDTGKNGTPFRRAFLNVVGAAVRSNILGQSLDSISSANGLALTVETVHLNSIGAAILTKAISDWLDRRGARTFRRDEERVGDGPQATGSANAKSSAPESPTGSR